MRIQILSDVHTEYHKDGGKSFVDSLDPSKADILVLAGDICSSAYHDTVLPIFCEKYKDIPVLLVNGNHDYYGSDRASVIRSFCRVENNYPNLHWLNHEVFEHMGQRFLGTPLWFRKNQISRDDERWFSDFMSIKDYRDWVYKENARAIQFLQYNLCPGDVVITHHLPSFRCVAPVFKDAASNCFFVCDIEELILDRKPAAHIFGHTHFAFDFPLGDTRMVCNPFGYKSEQGTNGFELHKIIEIEPKEEANGVPESADAEAGPDEGSSPES